MVILGMTDFGKRYSVIKRLECGEIDILQFYRG